MGVSYRLGLALTPCGGLTHAHHLQIHLQIYPRIYLQASPTGIACRRRSRQNRRSDLLVELADLMDATRRVRASSPNRQMVLLS
ncbi:MAG: hypothetical protein MUC60_18430 [Oscillatoria sp. Prado101]|nr:hypothetical protein [Oscillatoria sp. Prado101]